MSHLAIRLRRATLAVLGLWAAAAASPGCGGTSPTSPRATPTPAPAPQPAATARYQVTFEGTWSAATHPRDVPRRPHFSGLIGVTHAGSVSFWASGALASRGIQDMAERGSKTPLDAEFMAAIAAGSAGSILSGDGIPSSPGSVALEFEASREHPLVTLVSMIAPSPDWFVGVAGLPLLDAEGWRDPVVVELLPYDAGSDDGVTFESPDAESRPHVPIARLTRPPVVVAGSVPPFGRFVFRRR